MNSVLFPEVIATTLLFIGIWLISPRTWWSKLPVRILIVTLFQILNWRYVMWRWESTMVPFSLSPEAIWIWTFAILEGCATTVLAWHFLLLIKPSDRSKEADAAEKNLNRSGRFPGVDVLIPTYNESFEILKPTITAALALDYPNFEVFVLDDGARPWLKEYCDANSVTYISRVERKGFKAGNLNHALSLTSRPLVSVVDADFELKPNFLRRTVGLLDAPDVGIVQTPQSFKNPDAIQFNLFGEKAWPEAQCMFSDIMQPARDTWNNAFCYGTSFVIKRKCLNLCGGVPEETITEDLHTSYTLLAHGFKTRFLNENLSAGLATQDIWEFVRQRARWCIGSLQCLVVKGGVIRAKGLTLVDRLFFLDPVLYHIGNLWVLCVLLAPALYWWVGLAPFHSDFGHLLVVLGPRMLISVYGMYLLSNRKTLPIVTEIGRIVGLPYLISRVLNLIFNPHSQRFSTTKKEMDQTQSVIYWQLLRPHAILLTVVTSGMLLQFFGANRDLLFMQSNIGLMIALSLYVIWILFFSCLACIQRPSITGTLPSTVQTGTFRGTVLSLFTRMFASSSKSPAKAEAARQIKDPISS